MQVIDNTKYLSMLLHHGFQFVDPPLEFLRKLLGVEYLINDRGYLIESRLVDFSIEVLVFLVKVSFFSE